MNHYRFGYIDYEHGWTRVYECDAPNVNTAFYYFGKEMERRHGVRPQDKIGLIEVLENGISINW